VLVIGHGIALFSFHIGLMCVSTAFPSVSSAQYHRSSVLCSANRSKYSPPRLQRCVTSSMQWQSSWLEASQPEQALSTAPSVFRLTLRHRTVRERTPREACHWITRMVVRQAKQRAETQLHSRVQTSCEKQATHTNISQTLHTLSKYSLDKTLA
jgi:hypothetical protein